MTTETQQVNEIVNDAPEGYTVPAALARLSGVAEAHGWQWLGQWCKSAADEPYISVALKGPHTTVQLSWHSRDKAPGRLGLFSKLWRRDGLTDEHGRIIRQGWHWRHAPSLKAIEAAIAEQP